jgi:hypothetical protein
VPRSLTVVRGLLAASVVIALAGCTQAPAASSTDGCAGKISKVLLTDDSATTVAPFSAADVPAIFHLPATPVPTCYYKTVTTSPPSDGVAATTTHRTLLYVGLSDAEVAALIAQVRKTASVAPWSVLFDDGTAPAAATPAPAAAASGVVSSARWNYNFAGGAQDDKGQFGYYAAIPVNDGTAVQAGLTKSENVVRIETELRQVNK